MLPAESRSRRLRVLAAAIGVAMGVGLLVLAEMTTRVVDPSPTLDATQRTARDYQEWSSGPCYRIEGGRLLRVAPPQTGGARSEDGSADLPLAKAAGVRRLVVVGESTGEMLERALTALCESSPCKGQVEILKCSASGALPDVAVRRVEEAMAYSPDVVVVAIGHNFLLPGPPTQLQAQMARSRLAQELSRLGTPPTPRALNEPPEVESRDPPGMGREAYERILALTQPRGVPVIGLLLASNLWFRPKGEPNYIASVERALAWVKWAQGDMEGAIAALQAKDGSDNALRAFERAGFHALAGEWEAAREDLEKARDLEPASVRASSATTAAIADAARRGGAQLIDVAVLFSPLAEHHIPGWDIFFDHCHPNPEPLDLLAKTVLRTALPQADAAYFESRPSSPTSHDPEDVYRRLTGSPFQVFIPGNAADLGWGIYPDNGAWRRIVDGPFNAVLRLAPADAAAIVARYDGEQLAKYDAATRAVILAAIGGVARDAGRFDVARWCLERSREMQPAAPALIELALLHLHEGDADEARAAMDQARRLAPDSPLVRSVLTAMDEKPASSPR